MSGTYYKKVYTDIPINEQEDKGSFVYFSIYEEDLVLNVVRSTVWHEGPAEFDTA